MSYHGGSIFPAGASRKRKEGEAFYSVSNQARLSTKQVSKAEELASSNRLLAGYMAYEFLTRGTLFGQKLEQGRAEAVPSSAETEHKNYAEVATILKSDGAHIPGIVNPTQLARWIQM